MRSGAQIARGLFQMFFGVIDRFLEVRLGGAHDFLRVRLGAFEIGFGARSVALVVGVVFVRHDVGGLWRRGLRAARWFCR